MEVLGAWAQGPLVGLTGVVVGVLGLILTCIFYLKSRRMKRPCWAIRSNNLVSDFTARLPALDIRYANQKVENLTISKIIFWNAGSETIGRDDIAHGDPLEIVAIAPARLLDVKALKANSEPSRFAASLADESHSVAFLDFDFLDKNNGALIQVVHTGTSSKDVSLRGTIKGASKLKLEDVVVYRSRVGQILALVAGMLFAATGISMAFISVHDVVKTKAIHMGHIAFFVLGVLFAVGSLTASWKNWVSRLPAGLEVYREE
jgi:hypothetical protein